ncbi:hypothetical protein Acaty_m0076 (plasmid) [Acidithiobacillus caldus ATCC 51756]|uniref:Uncharacterized protein n=1 Tax=Acidithiobacillus caldus (strain ATCC 51756 / DSM 8584 / KU) TaxID=637389 RepID=A0A059ZV31_ACICK|nr:hypothetical protein Acaty_m0076 [Acidithiobacillus caldus ATCC 51756]
MQLLPDPHEVGVGNAVPVHEIGDRNLVFGGEAGQGIARVNDLRLAGRIRQDHVYGVGHLIAVDQRLVIADSPVDDVLDAIELVGNGIGGQIELVLLVEQVGGFAEVLLGQRGIRCPFRHLCATGQQHSGKHKNRRSSAWVSSHGRFSSLAATAG